MEHSLPPLGSYWIRNSGSLDQVVCVRDRFCVYYSWFVIFSEYKQDGHHTGNGQMTHLYLKQKYRQLSCEELAFFLLKKENHEKTY